MLKNLVRKVLFCLIFGILLFSLGLETSAFSNVRLSESDNDVSNYSSFSTDVIYQIVTDRFYNGDTSNDPSGDIYDSMDNRKYHGGDFRGITDKLLDNYFTDLGVSALWISSPIENIDYLDPADSSVSWTGASYHGYWGKDYFQTNPYFGTFDDFETLVTTAHNKNIKIVIDFAPNHTSTTNTYGTTWEQTKYPTDGGLYQNGNLIGNMRNDYGVNYFNHEGWINNWNNLEEVTYHSMTGLAELNQMNNTIDTYMKDSINMWLGLGVDGIRVDAVKHMPLGWQKNWVSNIYDNKPVFVFGEWFSGSTTPDSKMSKFANESGMNLLDFSLANSLRGAIGDLSLNMQSIDNTINETASLFNQVNNQVTFIDNHDMSRFMTLSGNTTHSVDTAYVIQLTERGVPAIYYGTEQYLEGETDPDNRSDMVQFDKTTTAYEVISRLAPLRKTNPALSYGTYTERYLNNDVYIFERKFGNSVVLTAVNRNTSTGYNLSNIFTSLPVGTYNDTLDGLLNGYPLTVLSGGRVPSYYLGAGACAVWQYNSPNETSPIIGNISPLMSKPGNIITLTGRGFGTTIGSVTFGVNNSTITEWSDTMIKVSVPNVGASTYTINVTNNGGASSGGYPNFKILTSSQTAIRFFVQNAYTSMGENVYLVGSLDELGAWNTGRAIGPMFNSTSSIASYPTWFFDVSIPKNTYFEYKYIKIDSNGNIVWESGINHIYTSGSNTGEILVSWH
ncbi:MAG: IPT/TIG domain-containing protein [Acholeplasmatales bacterium]|jgi:glycosidase|nr:IPT/TIG domain-containing protein [Acholeplasmatales bacterium]